MEWRLIAPQLPKPDATDRPRKLRLSRPESLATHVGTPVFSGEERRQEATLISRAEYLLIGQWCGRSNTSRAFGDFSL